MVNIQNPDIFSCQVLNRDVWSNHTVKSILNEHFIFWQVISKLFVLSFTFFAKLLLLLLELS